MYCSAEFYCTKYTLLLFLQNSALEKIKIDLLTCKCDSIKYLPNSVSRMRATSHGGRGGGALGVIGGDGRGRVTDPTYAPIFNRFLQHFGYIRFRANLHTDVRPVFTTLALRLHPVFHDTLLLLIYSFVL